VEVDLEPRRNGFLIEARVRTEARTGAEMEALHAVAVAALTVYDMVKAADRAMTITDIVLVRKTGGKSGEYRRRGGPRALSG
jgi:cyclic pyranopterin phosphate synthase